MHRSDAVVSFDGEALLLIGDMIEGDGLSVSLQYSAQVSALIGAEHAIVRDFGNTQGSFELPVVENMETVEAAYNRQEYLLQRWKRGKVAELKVGNNVFPSAALSGLVCAVGMSALRKPVVRINYSFICCYD